MRAFWDERARENAAYFVDSRQRYSRPDLDELFARGEQDLLGFLDQLSVELRPDDTVVEIGCGMGRLTRVIADRVARVVALDVSAEMLERADAANPALHNVVWQLGDGVSLAGLDDQSADACVSAVVFQHLPEPELALGYVREIGRVLRPGGVAAIQFSNAPGYHQRRLWPMWWLRARLRRGPRGYREPFWLGSSIALDDLRSAAGEAGLVVEKVVGEGTLFCCARLAKAAAQPSSSSS